MAYKGSKNSVKNFLAHARNDRKITVGQVKCLVKASYKHGRSAGFKSGIRAKNARNY